MANPEQYHFKLPPYQGDPLPEPTQAWYPGVQAHHANSTSERLKRGDGKIRAFVVHATAGASSSGAMSVLFEHRASWHWLIPDENEAEHGLKVWKCAPEARAAWHVRNDRFHPDVRQGEKNVNYWSLGVEIVNTQENDPFSDWQVEQAAALVRYAWSRYPDLVDVVSHAKLDPNRRSDPGPHFPWERFQELVLAPVAPVQAITPKLQILDPMGQPIDCDPQLLDGVIVVEARPLIERLGYRVVYQTETPHVVQIHKNSST